MTLIKNASWNLIGYIIPTLIAVPAIGFLAKKLPLELFGIFTIFLALVGYASIFDLGLTRAVIREISFFREDAKERAKIISTASIVIFLLGVFAMLLIFINLGNIINILKVSPAYYNDIHYSLILLAFTIPLYLMTQLWSSILEGDERFFEVNCQKSFSNSILALIPAVMILFGISLSNAILGLLIGRVISAIVAFYYVRDDVLNKKFHFYYVTFKRLFFFGGWMTISNIISPLMVYFDRFIISGMLGAKVVGFYTAPSEAVSRLSIIPGAIARALFPRLSRTDNDASKNKDLIFSYIILGVVCLPVALGVYIFSEFILTAWLGLEYGENSKDILKVLIIGFIFNSFAQIPFAIIQSKGKPKITAFIHCSEIIPYLIALYFGIKEFGIIGAAYVWTIRVIIDYFLLMFFSRYIDRVRG